MRIVIIGAGPAGLTAAYELLKDNTDLEVVVLEETNEIGGISKTVRYRGNRMDMGGHRFFSKSEEVQNWWNDRMAQQGAPAFDDIILNRTPALNVGGPNPETEDRVMLLRNRVSRIYYNNKFFDYPITLKASTLINMGAFTTLKAGLSYLKSSIKKRPENSLEDFYINRFGKVLYTMFFEDYTEKLWGVHPSNISADWGAQRVKGLSISALIKDIFAKLFKKETKETSLIENFLYPKLGPGQLWEEVAKDIEFLGGKVIKNCKVENLHLTNKTVDYIEANVDGKRVKIEADVFISSMPVKDLILGIKGEKPSEEIYNIAKYLPYRDFITVGLLLNKLEIKNKTKLKTLGDIIPDCWIYVQDRGVKLGRIQIFNNWSPYMVKDPQKTVFIGLEYFCREGDEFWGLSDQDIINFAIREVEKIGIASNKSVLDSHLERVKKAYPAYFGTYKDMDKVVEYLNSINNLYCIGRNGQHRYNNMDHSMLTAMKTAELIKFSKGTRDDIWNVNTEREYHEKK